MLSYFLYKYYLIITVFIRILTTMIICAKPGQVRHTKFPFKCLYIHMVVPPGIMHDILMNSPDFLETENTMEYKQIFSEMINLYNNFSDVEDIKIYSLILDIIYRIKNDVSKQHKIKATNNNISVIEKTLNYIDNHLTEDLSLERLSEITSISPIHFHNIFKTSTGKTLRKYVEEQRIKKAINLLFTTNYTLTQIAYECGFGSQSYFSYAFKRKMNYSPRDYVRKMAKKYEM